jgi:putative aldouronate transport system substrate-binding protein
MKRVSFIVLVLLAAGGLLFAGAAKQTEQNSSPAGYGPVGTGLNPWMAKYDKPVTIHVVNKESVIEYEAGDDMTRNEWTRGYKKFFNIDVVTDWIAPAAEYDTKLNLAISSGQIPDVFMCNAVQFRQLLEANMLADITDYIDNNATTRIKEILASAQVQVETAKKNGRLMGMPQFGYGDINLLQELWIRHDWFEAAGNKIPVTIADLENLMKTFMQTHPGAYGITLDKTLGAMNVLANGFNAHPGLWMKGTDGKIVYGSVQPEMKAVLTTFADWYKKGYIRRDFMSADGTAVGQELVAGRYGITTGGNSWGYGYAADLVKNHGNNAYFEAYDIPSSDGKPTSQSIRFDNAGYLAIRKGFSPIDAAIKCMSFYFYVTTDAVVQGLMTPEEQYKYQLKDSMANHSFDMFQLLDYVSGNTFYDRAQALLKSGDRSKVDDSYVLAHYDLALGWIERKDPTGIGVYLQNWAERCGNSINSKVLKENRLVRSQMTGPAPREIASLGATLDDILMEGFTKIIIGQEPVSYFDSLVSQWKVSGGDNATAAMNRDYGNK